MQRTTRCYFETFPRHTKAKNYTVFTLMPPPVNMHTYGDDRFYS